MKRKKLFFCILLAVMMTCFAFVACIQKTYTVTFMDGDTAISALNKQVVDGKTVDQPAEEDNPTKVGFVFSHWSLKEYGEPYDWSKAVTGNLTLYAVWDVAKLTVTFMLNEDNVYTSQQIEYGKAAVVPTKPMINGQRFTHWATTDGGTTAYDFPIIITDVTLYACFTAIVPLNPEWTISFDLNYTGAPANPISLTTMGGMLMIAPVPANRADFEFIGWWVSHQGDGGKLSYPLDTQVTIFEEDTTLYAFWQPAVSGSKLRASIPQVVGNSVICTADERAAQFRFVITGPGGFVSINEPKPQPTISVPFSTTAPAGDYTIKVTAESMTAENNSDPVTIHYRNKALARVTQFEVQGFSTLVFNTVKNATHYLLTVECKDTSHSHTDLNLGEAEGKPIASYDFGDCIMKPGGIKFVVKAAQNGWITSVSETFTYERNLPKVTGYSIDPLTQIISWTQVENASGYIVTVECDDTSHLISNVETKTASYPLKECAIGDVTVGVVAKGDNDWNPSPISEHEYDKSTLAAPRGILVNMQTEEATWTAVPNTIGYTVKISTAGETPQIFDNITVNKFDLSLATYTPSKIYQFEVMANGTGTTSSLWSNSKTIQTLLFTTFDYADNTVTWPYVMGITQYRVKINGGYEQVVTGNSAQITLVAKVNTITVEAYGDGVWSAPVTIVVSACEISFDSGDGGSDVDSIFVRNGDEVNLATPTKTGYNFAGWYPQVNGSGQKYEATIFTGSADMLLFANWTAKIYNGASHTYDYSDKGEGPADKTFEVKFDAHYQMIVPTAKTGDLFIGWYTKPGGNAVTDNVRLTDELGKSINPWTISADTVTVYAWFGEVLKYYTTLNNDQDREWTVMRGKDINLVRVVTIPLEYDDKDSTETTKYGKHPVTVIEAFAFLDCNNLVEVRIHQNVRSLSLVSFDGCTKLEKIDIHSENKKYLTVDGVLFEKYKIDEKEIYEILFFPYGKRGEYTIPDFMRIIPAKIFQNRSLITKINIPSSVIEIEAEAFRNCIGLLEVIFLEQEKGEPLGQNVIFGDGANPSVTSSRIFRGCLKLHTIYFSDRITYIPLTLFAPTENLANFKNINISDNNKFYGMRDGVLYNAPRSVLVYYPFGREGHFNVPRGTLEIGRSAFSNHMGLTSIFIPNSVTIIGNAAFYQCYNLESVVIEDGIEPLIIGTLADNTSYLYEDSVFRECNKLTEIIIPGRTTAIGNYAFFNCYFLESVSFSGTSQLTHIYMGAFQHNYRLGSLTIPGTVILIGNSAFYANEKITSINIPAGVKSIGNSAFEKCYALEDVDFEEGFNGTFGSGVFRQCYSLTSFYVTAKMTTIATSVFDQTGLKNITVSEDNNVLQDVSGVLYSKGAGKGATGNELIYYPGGRTGAYTVPAGTVTLRNNSFAYHKGITEITIPSSVKNIGVSATSSTNTLVFYQSSITKIIFLSGGMESLAVGNHAFRETPNLTEAILPNRTISIGIYAFLDSGLQKVFIPNTVATMGWGTFSGCTSLFDVEFEKGGTADLDFGASFGGTSTGWVFVNCSSLESITIPFRTTNMYMETFRGASRLKEVIFEDGTTAQTKSRLTNIGNQTFENCHEITSLIIPSSVKTIGNAFINMGGLEEVTFMSAIESIGENAFQSSTTAITVLKKINVLSPDANFVDDEGVLYSKDMSVLIKYPARRVGTTYQIPASTTTIANYAFEYANNLKSITFQENLEGSTAESLIIGSGASTTSGYSFQRMANLESITLPDRLTSISGYAFQYCSSLKTIQIPAGVAMGGTVFGYCSSLTSAAFLGDVTAFGTANFRDCVLLSSVNIPTGISAPLGANTFLNCRSLTTLHLPASATGTITATALNGTSGLQSFSVDSGNTAYQEIAGVIYNKTGTGNTATQLLFYPQGKTGAFTDMPVTVTTIGASAFNGASLSSISFPATGFTTINANAFQNTKNLKLIALPETLTTLGTYAFSGSGLTSIHIPGKVTSTNTYTFRDCADLISVTFAKGDDTRSLAIGQSAFLSCRNLDSITFESSINLVTIGPNFIADCPKLDKITIPKSVRGTSSTTGLSQYAFSGITAIDQYTNAPSATGLKTVTYETGSQVTRVNPYTFEGCVSLQEIVGLPDDITYIGNYAFAECHKLGELTLPSKLATGNDGAATTGIGTNAFQNCRNLEELLIPAGITRIQNLTFQGCENLTSINIPYGVKTIGNSAFEGCSLLEEIIIPDTVRDTVWSGTTVVPGIGNYSFRGCNSLTTVYLPAGVSSLGTTAAYTNPFADCIGVEIIGLDPANTNLITDEFGVLYTKNGKTLVSYPSGKTDETYEIPAGVETIANGAFQGAIGIKHLTIPGSVTTIGAFAFADCSSLISIDIPSSVISIGNNAFQNCTALTSIIIPDSIVGGSSAFGTNMFNGCSDLENVTLSSNIESLGVNTFLNCISLKNINVLLDEEDNDYVEGLITSTLPAGLSSIGNNSFQNCISLESIIIPREITSLGTFIFAGCTALEVVNYKGQGLTSISGNAFNGCTSLKKINIPNSVTSISTNAFQDCTSLVRLDLPIRVSTINNFAFANCTALTTINLGNITVINANIFNGCTNLATVVIPERVSTIQTSAFAGCTNLQTLNIPSRVTTIQASAFSGCTKLNLTIPSNVINIQANAFSGWNGSQTLTIKGRTATTLPVGWVIGWDADCAANKVYA